MPVAGNPTLLPRRTWKPGAEPAEVAAQWAEARLVYPLYLALAQQFDLGTPPCRDGEGLDAHPSPEIFERVWGWLDSMDQLVQAHQLRQLLTSRFLVSEECLRALILHHLRKQDKAAFDRDKIDFLLAQYFALCAPEQIYNKEIDLADVARVLNPILGEVDVSPLEWCEPLEQIQQHLRQFHSLRDLLEGGFLEQGRLLKESAGGMFYDPSALVAFCRFNFVMRRAFIRLVHQDQQALHEALNQLEIAGVKSVDCRRAGLSAAESTARLQQICQEWRLPSQRDYSELSVARAFERLLAIRADAEEALAVAQGKTVPAPKPAASPAARIQPPKTRAAEPAPAEPEKAALPAPGAAFPDEESSTQTQTPSPAPAAEAKPASTSPGGTAKSRLASPALSTTDLENCLEAIWEQLIAAPAARGRSMSTIVLEETKILLSSWEVAAFVSEGGTVSDDLRRAVVARALVAMARDKSRSAGDSGPLDAALAHARSEVSYLQSRVEQAKRAKDTEAAVNLGITAKRLLSLIEEAGKIEL